MHLIKYIVFASSAAVVLSACAPITPFPQTPTQQQRTQQSSSGMPAGLPPSSSLPSGSTSSSSGAPSNSPQSSSAPGGGPSMPGTLGNESSSTSGGADSDASEDGWLEGLPSPNAAGNGNWQTSNQSMPEDGMPQQSPAGAKGTGDDKQTNGGEDEELTEVLSDLDGNILAEREALRKTGNTETESTASSGGDSGAQGSAQAGAVARARGGNTPPPPKRGDKSGPGDEIDARDDDIIARQLREAAMQETDPELKEKLWAEYRRYKRG